MNHNLEAIVRSNLTKALKQADNPAFQLDMDEDLTYGYGLTSLDMIMLMSSTCAEAGIPLTELAEDDIGKMKTPRDILVTLSTRATA
ncbi:hypothetical protein NU688_32265 [Variovorax sp. ZS18.2.2]|uniref:hypothetical protein n=1 Tax=Variovorax sp. ZS18.2.2 TaxID=2971255 RepID=UPI002151E69A|nr:hypothetical protein [Variovorax sp. ZS18.2.2]MCR6480870.1 hypothetical protein [Variovorax sp. ZS18.2.2]